MAKRLILIPDEMYRGLMTTAVAFKNKSPSSTTTVNQLQKPYGSDNENLGFKFVRENLEKIKKKRIRNLSNKSIAYNQELRRYLRLKKEQDNKPIKVKLSNGINLYTYFFFTIWSHFVIFFDVLDANLLIKPNVQAGVATPATATAAAAAAAAAVVDDPANVTGNADSLNNSTITRGSSRSSLWETPKQVSSPLTPKLQRVYPKILEHSSAAQKIYDYIMENRFEFGVDENGKILRDNNEPFRNSSIAKCILHYLEHTSGMVSPPGFIKLKPLLDGDPLCHQLMLENRQQRKGGHFVGKLQQQQQHKKGRSSPYIKSEIFEPSSSSSVFDDIVKSSTPRSTNPFRPNKWTL
jgi:hypothetical protein